MKNNFVFIHHTYLILNKHYPGLKKGNKLSGYTQMQTENADLTFLLVYQNVQHSVLFIALLMKYFNIVVSWNFKKPRQNVLLLNLMMHTRFQYWTVCSKRSLTYWASKTMLMSKWSTCLLVIMHESVFPDWGYCKIW